MPLQGPTSSKYGERFEGKWTVLQILDLLRSRATSITIVPPFDDGCEFSVCKDDITEYHQVKRQNSAGQWSLSLLSSIGVLSYFKTKISHPNYKCVFVSVNSANQLRELSERARSATSFADFEKDFLRAKEWRGDFNELCKIWQMQQEEKQVFEYLKRIIIRTIDETTLLDDIVNKIEPLIEGNPLNAVDVLAQFALDNLNKRLSPYDVWAHLEGNNRGFRRKNWANSEHVLSAVTDLQHQYCESLKGELISATSYSRSIAEKMIDSLINLSIGQKGVIITGEAGVGKSVVILQIIQQLQMAKWPFLPFRINSITPVTQPSDLGEQLGLPDSPVHILYAISADKPALLIIDQLDAISMVSGRNPQFFDTIQHLLNQTIDYQNIRILIACRKFDLENDFRLKDLTGEKGFLKEFEVKRLDKEQVSEVIRGLGIDPSKVSEAQFSLLSLPVHLKLLSHLIKESGLKELTFLTSKDLFDRFWDYKQQIIGARIGRAVNWSSIIDLMCDYMNSNQLLSVPKINLDQYNQDAQAMISEHVLIQDRNKYLFFHESFFDYSFARRFAAKGKSLLAFLTSAEQLLFKRAQTRQILTHQRDADPRNYLLSLKGLLSSDKIRFHLQQVAISLVANLTDPTQDEFEMVILLLNNCNKIVSQNLVRAVSISASWFDMFERNNVLKIWLDCDELLKIERAMLFLTHQSQKRPADVARHLELKLGKSDEWNKRVLNVLFYAHVGISKELYGVFLKCIDMGLFDSNDEGTPQADIEHMLYSLEEGSPERACEAASRYISRYYKAHVKNLSPDEIGLRDILPGGRLDPIILQDISKKAAKAFVNNFLPLILQIISGTLIKKEEKPPLDSVFHYRYYGGSYSTAESLLTGMVTAMRQMAETDPDILEAKISEVSNIESDTIQYLIELAYSANGLRFANQAAAYLCEKPYRFDCGYVNSHYWVARQLLRAITPHCSKEWITQLEEQLLNYYPPWEKSVNGYKERGIAQLSLLNGFDSSRLSQKAKGRLEELRRKFIVDDIKMPESMEVKVIGSPIPETAMHKMTDAHWKKAIKRYYMEHDFTRGRDLRGGSQQLSILLGRATKENPKRFVRLGLQFEDSTHPYYFNAILRGLTESDIPVGEALQYCYRCHNISNKSCGRYIHGLIAKYAEIDLPSEALELVAWYAINDPDPEKDGQDLLSTAINSSRGTAAESMGKLIFQNKARIDIFKPAIEKMVCDKSLAVRSTVAFTLISIYKHDPDYGIHLFVKLCDADDILLGTHYVERFLYFATRTYYQKLEQILSRMIASEKMETAEVGARQVCLASFFHPEALQYVERCKAGNIGLQKGLAQIYASNVTYHDFRSFCEAGLKVLCNSEHKEIRREVASCFNHFKGNEIGNFEGLVSIFVDSPAFLENTHPLMHALENSTAKMPEIVLKIAEKYIQELQSSEQITRMMSITDDICKLVMRLYSQSDNVQTRRRCLNIFDELLKMGVYGINEVLSLHDR
jgi:hypothetical protein